MVWDALDVIREARAGVRLDPKVKVVYVRADCDGCFRWECLPVYQRDVGRRNFVLGFFRCSTCERVACEICMPPERGEHLTCPFCGREGMRKLKPSKLYACHMCVVEDKRKYCESCDDAV